MRGYVQFDYFSKILFCLKLVIDNKSCSRCYSIVEQEWQEMRNGGEALAMKRAIHRQYGNDRHCHGVALFVDTARYNISTINPSRDSNNRQRRECVSLYLCIPFTVHDFDIDELSPIRTLRNRKYNKD